MNPSTIRTTTSKHFGRSMTALLLLSVMLSGCAVLEEMGSADRAQTASTETASDADAVQEEQNSEHEDAAGRTASPELAQAEAQVKALEQQLETLKVEWEQQKPALERLVSNEADLEFLVQALADMSQLADEPSRSQYLGQDELTPEKQEQSLAALQSLVTTQEELNTLLVELSSVVADVAANSQNAGNQSTLAQTGNGGATQQQADAVAFTGAQSDDTQQTIPPSGEQMHQQSSTNANTQAVNSASSASLQASADCNCSNTDPSSSSHSAPARAKDPSWFAMTTPYAEAQPAGSNTKASQLDGAAVSGQPIPGLEVKTFKRRTLPSELAAAGADLKEYALAPQFHMSRKSLSDYVAQLAFKLAGNQQLAGNKVGVTSFVFFDEQLEQTSSVGNQLAEELSTVLPGYGARVVEYKLTRQITVGPTGDLSLSRNSRKLSDSLGMDYVLTGTMVPTRRGLQINSRVVSTRDNVVIASASTLIPAMVLQQL